MWELCSNANGCREQMLPFTQIRGLMLPSQACISEHPGFEGNCLNPWVLEASVYEFVFEDGPLGDDQPINE